jgi:hypothetical protein
MLTEKEIKMLAQDLVNAGLPAGFQGDRLDAFRLGLSAALEVLKDKVSVDTPKEEKKCGT